MEIAYCFEYIEQKTDQENLLPRKVEFSRSLDFFKAFYKWELIFVAEPWSMENQ